MSIFVAIAAYRDPWLWRTVHDCLAKAADPKAIRFGIVEQSETPSRIAPESAAIARYLHVNHQFSRGVCWARSLTYGLYQDEDYLLQIDSHMLFAPGWDRMLIRKLEALAPVQPRAVISTYPYAFTETDGQIRVQGAPGHALVLRVVADSEFKNGSPVLMFEAAPTPATTPIVGCHVAAGCLFTRGAFVEAVPYDPRLYFHGEEQNLAIRAWTRGWDLFHVPDMPIFHLYKQPSPDAAVHWNAADDAARAFRFSDLQSEAANRLRALVVEGRDLGVYGLGTARSLADFAAFSGIDYPNLRLERRAVTLPWAGKPQAFFF
jgi:hypothetical protein